MQLPLRTTALWIAMTSACGASSNPTGTVARPAGCSVEVATSLPSRATHVLGRVVAHCRGAVASDDVRCNRTLQDQACAMGATVMWDVSSDTSSDGEERVMHATAAVYRQ